MKQIAANLLACSASATLHARMPRMPSYCAVTARGDREESSHCRRLLVFSRAQSRTPARRTGRTADGRTQCAANELAEPPGQRLPSVGWRTPTYLADRRPADWRTAGFVFYRISLVNVAKSRMQQLRSDGWDNFLKKVTSFCTTHGVEVPAMDGAYVPYGKSARYARARNQINDDHFRREVYIGVIDQISQELDNRFDEINMELLSCMSAFSPSQSFASFDAQKVRRLAEFYRTDFSSNNLLQLELQLDNYIDDMKRDERFQGLDNIVDLSVKLVETNRHKVYDMVYLLLKLVLLLPVATASVERVFSGLVLVKTKSRNKLGDTVLDDCLLTFIERDIFLQVDEDDIMETFMSLRKRRINK